MAKSTNTTAARKSTVRKNAPELVMNHAQSLEDDSFADLMKSLGAGDDEIVIGKVDAGSAQGEVILANPADADDEALKAIGELTLEPVAEAAALVVMPAAGEVIAPAAAAAPADIVSADDALLDSVLNKVESVDDMLAAATLDKGDAGGAAPTDEATALIEAAANEADLPAADAAPKRTPVPRKHYTDKVERLVDRMGKDLGEFTVLTMADAVGAVDEEQLQHRMEETLVIIRAMNKKQQVRAGFLMEFISGKKTKLNDVMARLLGQLQIDGHLTTGKDGNVLKNLLSKPYSEGTARAVGYNSVGVFHELKLLNKIGKDRYEPNADSLILGKVLSMLSPADAAA